MAIVKTQPVDRRLMEVLKGKGLKPTSISRELGHNDSYISQCVIAKGLPIVVINYLDKVYGIPYSDYEPRKEVLTQEAGKLEIDQDEIVKMVARSMGTFAVKDELGRAVRFSLLDEHTQDMFKKMIKEACTEAVEEVLKN